MQFISPLQIIRVAIAEAIYAGFGIRLKCHEIVLEASFPKYSAHYTSSVAIALCPRLAQDSLTIAEEIIKLCIQTRLKSSYGISLDNSSENRDIDSQWQIQAVGKGWLNINFTEQYLGEILLLLEKLRIAAIEDTNGIWQKGFLISDQYIIEDNYAYARCCALIRLAYREHLLPLVLEKNSKTIFTEVKPVETSLLVQNLAIADYLMSAQENCTERNHKKTQEKQDKLSRSLADVFLQFYDQCRIYGVNRDIAWRRLLLIRITQKFLLALAPTNINYTMYL